MLDFGQEPPLCRFGSLLSSAVLDRVSGSHCVTPSGKTHLIKHVFMSLQPPNPLCKSPTRYHCISLIIDFQQRLACNRRANCSLGFRDCSLPAGDCRHIWWNWGGIGVEFRHLLALPPSPSAASRRLRALHAHTATRVRLEWCKGSPGQADDEHWHSSASNDVEKWLMLQVPEYKLQRYQECWKKHPSFLTKRAGGYWFWVWLGFSSVFP